MSATRVRADVEEARKRRSRELCQRRSLWWRRDEMVRGEENASVLPLLRVNP